MVQVTSIRLNRIDTGLEITLETAAGKPLQVDATKFRAEGNSLIADIPNTMLALPEGQTFVAENPTADVASVRVVQQDTSSIRISVTGNNALPKSEVTLKTGELAYSLNPEADEPDEEIVVTGEGRGRYNAPNASTATRTDTPIRDLPASIQVVPRQVIEDRGIRNELEAIETVSGVLDSDTRGIEAGISNIAIRGFSSDFSSSIRLRDGLRSEFRGSFTPIGAIEQVEVLKGPASVLFGALEPGGIVNIVTRKPLAEPYYRIGFEAGNYGLYQPSIDFSGPLTKDGSVLYRLIAAYQGGGDYKDSTPIQDQITSITPSFRFRLGDRTNLSLNYEYSRFYTDRDIEPLLSDGSLIPSKFYPYYFSLADRETNRFGYTLNHEFNDSWQLRHSLSTTFATYQNRAI